MHKLSHFGPSQRRIFLLLLAILVCTFLVATPSKTAEAHSLIAQKTSQANISPVPCGPSNGAAHENCYAPYITLNKNCTGTQYWNTTDYSNVPISYTYTNGSSVCVSATYSTINDSRNCSYEFYVPNGYATASFVIGYVEAGVHHRSGVINENNITGWYTFLSNVHNVTSFDFSDNNGQTPGGYLIGWGSDWHYSLLSWCS